MYTLIITLIIIITNHCIIIIIFEVYEEVEKDILRFV